MTVDSQNIEAVSSRTKPTPYITARSFAEAVLSCPKCGNAMEPMILGMKDDGTQTVWWTCSEVKAKTCTFPLDMPQEIFWVERSPQDIARNEVPPPNLKRLPIRYQHLYPSLFQSTSKRKINDSRQGSHESTRSISSMESAGSSNSAWDLNDISKSRTAIKLDAMRKPKLVMTQKKSFIPSMNGGNRALAFAESFSVENRASSSITTKLKFGRGELKKNEESREKMKKRVIEMLKNENPNAYKTITPKHIRDMKNAVAEHVKKRRLEREQVAELERMTNERNKVVDINDLVKAKLLKNKREYEQRRIEKAREARLMAARAARAAKTAEPSFSASFSMPGYDEEDDGEQRLPSENAPYAVTPPHASGAASPGPSTSTAGYYTPFFSEFDYGLEESLESSSGLDHSGDVAGGHAYSDEGDVAVSPFTDLGPLRDEDLDGLETDPDFQHAFAEAFGDDFADDFTDMNQYN